MDCRDVEQAIKPFLDDLLTEEKYQGIHTHLDSCPKCKQYVGAIGSFSYVLRELGEVKVPGDLADSVIFRLKAQTGAVKPTRVKQTEKVLIAALVGTAVIGAVAYFQHLEPEVGTPIAANQAARDANISPPPTAEPPVGKPQAVPEPAVAPAAQTASVPKIVPIHWHYPDDVGGKAGRQMITALTRSGAEVDYTLQELVVLSLAGSRFRQFVGKMNPIDRRMLPVDEAEIGTNAEPDQKVHLSVYFEKSGETASNDLHWDIGIAKTEEHRLFSVFHQMGLSLDYDSPELVVLKVSSTQVAELIDRIRTIGGLTGTDRLPFPPGGAPMRPMRISVSLRE